MGAYWRFRLLLDYAGDQLWQEAQLFIWMYEIVLSLPEIGEC
jgi:hypothetical protein